MVVEVIRGYKMFLAILLIEWYGLSSSQCRLWLSILSVVMSTIPIILFIALYRLGRRIDMRSTYVDVSASLFIGCVLAHFFGYVVGFFINPVGRETWTSVWTSTFEMAAMQGFSYGLYLFFLGFTAIALAYLRSREGQVEAIK